MAQSSTDWQGVGTTPPAKGWCRWRLLFPYAEYGLLPDSQALDQGPITVNALALKVVEQPSALSDQHEQATPGMVILLVSLEVLRQIIDTLGKQGYLHFRGPGVHIVGPELFNYFLFPLGCERHILNDPPQVARVIFNRQAMFTSKNSCICDVLSAIRVMDLSRDNDPFHWMYPFNRL